MTPEYKPGPFKDEHELALERANSAHIKRLKDKQKRWGKPHDDEATLVERANVQRKNSDALVQLMLEYNFLIPARTFPLWRPTQRTRGAIDGVHDGLTLIATDGVLGWFITHEGVPWLGHIQCFSEVDNIKPLFSFEGQMSSKAKIKTRKRVKSKRQILLDSL